MICVKFIAKEGLFGIILPIVGHSSLSYAVFGVIKSNSNLNKIRIHERLVHFYTILFPGNPGPFVPVLGSEKYAGIPGISRNRDSRD